MTRFLKLSVLGLVLAGGMVASSEAVVVGRWGFRAPVAIRAATPVVAAPYATPAVVAPIPTPGQMLWLNPQPEPPIFIYPSPVLRRAIIR
jgi:hypothetical protein